MHRTCIQGAHVVVGALDQDERYACDVGERLVVGIGGLGLDLGVGLGVGGWGFGALGIYPQQPESVQSH